MLKDTKLLTIIVSLLLGVTALSAAVWADTYYYNGFMMDIDRFGQESASAPPRIVYTCTDETVSYDQDGCAEKITSVAIDIEPLMMSDLGLPHSGCSVINGEILEKVYSDDYGNRITLRTMLGRYDLSGDDGMAWSRTGSLNIDGVDVTICGGHSGWYKATIIGSDRSWSVTSTFPLTQAEMEDLVLELLT